MLSIFKALIQQYFLIAQYNIIFVGLQNTGKTRLFNIIKHFDNLSSKLPSLLSNYNPTVGLNTTKFKSKQARLVIWDLGGKKTIRKLWQNYYPETHGIVFFIDDKTNDKLEESFQLLKQVCIHNQMTKIPLLLLIKKSETKQQLLKMINKDNQLFNRQYSVQILIFQQIGVLGDPQLSISKQKLRTKQILKWMYSKIVELDRQVKKY